MFGLLLKNKKKKQLEEEIKILKSKLESNININIEEQITLIPFDKSRIEYLLRDPRCVYVYWEISEKKFKEMEKVGKIEGIIGLYPQNPERRKYEFPVSVDKNYGSFYFNDVEPDTIYCVKLNLISKKNFSFSLRTKSFRTFKDKPSDDTSEIYSTQKELLKNL
ncbi:MAG: DUF4912 domain-containing protein [Candidatus Pacearchaeota archaeon]